MRDSFNTDELRAELARRGWRQCDLANQAGLSLSLTKWICRGARPSPSTARRILDAVGPEADARITGAPYSSIQDLSATGGTLE